MFCSTSLCGGASRKVHNLRGAHVHQVRLNDKTIDRLGGIDLQAHALRGARWRRRKADAIFRRWYDQEYRKARETWREWISSGNAETRKVLDYYFENLYAVVFNADSTVRYPNNLKF